MSEALKNIYLLCIPPIPKPYDYLSMAVLGFNFPPDSGEKVTLEITVLMSLTMFMNMVSSMQPPSSETPLIGTYFSCIMIMVASSVVCTIMILNYHHRLATTHTMSVDFDFHWICSFNH